MEADGTDGRDRPGEHDGADDRFDKRVQSRADSIGSDEERAGSDDHYAQAEAILADSDARSDDRVNPPGKPVESGQSDDNVD